MSKFKTKRKLVEMEMTKQAKKTQSCKRTGSETITFLPASLPWVPTARISAEHVVTEGKKTFPSLQWARCLTESSIPSNEDCSFQYPSWGKTFSSSTTAMYSTGQVEATQTLPLITLREKFKGVGKHFKLLPHTMISFNYYN